MASTHPICQAIWNFIWAKYCPSMKQKSLGKYLAQIVSFIKGQYLAQIKSKSLTDWMCRRRWGFMGGLITPAPGADNTEPVFQIPVGLPSLERGRRVKKRRRWGSNCRFRDERSIMTTPPVGNELPTSLVECYILT